MGEAALEALTIIFSGDRFLWIVLGVFIGLFMGIIPGLGGMVGMSLLLPFVFGMDPYSGIALLIGMMAVVQTGDTFPAVLLGIPGTVGSQATIMDGYPLARQGQAGRALGAAFLASMIGGLFGALILFAALPVARPLVLALRSPELFMLTILGLTLVGVLSRGAPVRGVATGFVGLLLSAIGIAPAATDSRFTFDTFYLMGGLSLVIIALGLFAIPEIIELVVEDKAIAKNRAGKLGSGILAGMRDTLRHKRIVLQSAAVGPTLGMIPGVGGSIIDWFTYGLASQTSRKNNRFGHGDIRGVIAPESANNSKEGGQLIPTLLFGIPGGGTTAILLGGLVLLGVQPGPRMVEEQNLPILLVVVWTLAIANVMGTALCIALSRPISAFTLLPSRAFAPFLFAVVLFASFQANRQWGDIVLVLAIGLVAYIMKILRWPRVPMLIGFVLGPASERYLTISVNRYGMSWLMDPMVIGIGVLAIVSVAFAVYTSRNSVEEAVIY